MYNQILEKIGSVVSQIPPVFLFLLVIVLGMYKFWKECSITRKENNSIFDMFFFSSIFGLILGRASYIISNWEEFSKYIWYWLPYEKYGDQIFLFRLLPWRFLRIWDWEIQIIVMFVGFVVSATIWAVFVKKWKWSHLYTPIFSSATSMIALSFLLIGLFVNQIEWVTQGLFLLVPIVLLLISQRIIRDRIIGKREMRFLAIVEIFFLSVTTGYLVYSYRTVDSTIFEIGAVLLLFVWFLFGSLVYILEINKANVTIEKVSSLGVISDSDIKSSIRLSK